MYVEKMNAGFKTVYDKGVIRQSVVMFESNEITLFYKSGKIKTLHAPRRLTGFHSQFGISISNDGQLYFIQDWEHNKLYCYQISDNSQQWVLSIRHPYYLILSKKTLICDSSGYCTYKIRVDDGTVLEQLHYHDYRCHMMPIGNGKFWIGPIQKQYQIRDTDLNIVAYMPIITANPKGYDTFLVNTVEATKDSITISGFEYMSDDLTVATKKHCGNIFIENSKFIRNITAEDGVVFSDFINRAGDGTVCF